MALDELTDEMFSSEEPELTCMLRDEFAHDLSFCIGIDHPTPWNYGLKALTRDARAKRAFLDLEASSTTRTDVSMQDIIQSHSTCQRAIELSLCLGEFPVCDCNYQTACKNACETINDCAEELGGGIVCISCANMCDATCVDPSSAGTRARILPSALVAVVASMAMALVA